MLNVITGYYANKSENLDEKDTFFKNHDLAKLIQEKIENPKNPILLKTTKSII